jgi:hypothetical protein
VEVGKGPGGGQGDCQLEVGRRAAGWDSLCPGRGTPEEHTLLKVNSVTKKKSTA